MDAFFTLNFFHPVAKLTQSSAFRIPILMYHSVSDEEVANRHPYFHTLTTPKVFAEHMQVLHDGGYSVIDLDTALEVLDSPARAAKPSVVLTFDDGFRDFYLDAFPIMNRFGFSATMFLPTAYIGKSPREFKGTECLTWNEVRELQTAGIQFGSHTMTHSQLTSLTLRDIDNELRSSKRMIEDELGEPVTSFAYPYALPEANRVFTRTLRGALEEAGYQNGVSTIIGRADRADDQFFLKRLPVNSFDDHRLLQAKLKGGYDWLHGVQYASKLLKVGRG